MVNENDLWEYGNIDLEEEDYVLVRQEDIVEGIACFMAAYLLSLKQTKVSEFSCRCYGHFVFHHLFVIFSMSTILLRLIEPFLNLWLISHLTCCIQNLYLKK